MNPWDVLKPTDLSGWKPIDEREPTADDLDWMKRAIEVPDFDVDVDPGDETNG